MDGDGIDEVAISDPHEDSVWLFEGAPGGLQHDDPTHITASDGPWADGGDGPADYWFGSYGGSLDMGDLNGDGLQDLAVGATGGTFVYDYYGGDEPGAVYLHLGSPRGLDRISRTKVRPCPTHWEGLHPETRHERMGVNARLFDPSALEGIRIRRFDGADTWTFLD